MIRDPSDGSVREAPKAEVEIPTSTVSTPSGLRQPTRTDAQMRLEKSRCWLKDYLARKTYPQKSEETAPSGLPD